LRGPELRGEVAWPDHEVVNEGRSAEVEEKVVVLVQEVALVAHDTSNVSVLIAVLNVPWNVNALIPAVGEYEVSVAHAAVDLQSVVVE
jgi:hypothetical protein